MRSIFGYGAGLSARALVLLITAALVGVGGGPVWARTKDDARLVTLDAGPAHVGLYGLLQAQLALYTGKDNLVQDGDPAQRIGGRLRRARIGFDGELYGRLKFALTVQATQRGIALLDAWVVYRQFSWLSIEIGADKVPYSRFDLLSSSHLALIGRPVSVQAMAPDRQVGLTVSGSIAHGAVSYAVGVYNGFERSTNFYEGYTENTAMKGNRFNNLAYAGRLEFEPFGPLGDDEADLEGGGFRLGVGTSAFYSDGETTNTTAWDADLAMKVKGFHFIFEYLADIAAPKHHPTTVATIPSKLARMALSGDVGYVFWPNHMGLTFRTEYINDDEHLKNNGDALLFTPGLAYYWHREHVKAQLEYIHRLELYGISRDNDTVLFQLQLSL